MKIKTTLTARKTLKLGAGVAFAALLGGTVNLGWAQETTANDSAPSGATAAVSADDWSAEHEPGTRKTLDINGVEFAFRYCPGGSLEVGTPDAPKVLDVDDGYWTLETEVTCAMWKAVVGRDQSQWGPDSDTPGPPQPWTAKIPEKYADDPAVRRCVERWKKVDAERFPTDYVSWQMAQDFVGKLNDAGVAPEGFEFRLPTEAEWEQACRAGTTTRYYWGDEWDCDKAHANDSAWERMAFRIAPVGVHKRDRDSWKPLPKELFRPVEVGLFEPNPWGIYDMLGNVAEWTTEELEPVETEFGALERVSRGGHWNAWPSRCCSDSRALSRGEAQVYTGLRVILGRKAAK